MGTTQGNSRSPTAAEVIRGAFESMRREMYVALPGSVQDYNPTKQTASIKPLIQRNMPTSDGGELLEALPVIPDVPIVFMRTQTAFVTMPVKPGDHVLLVFNMYSIDAFMAGDGSDTQPGDFRMHDISDPVALLGFYPNAKALANVDPENIIVGFDGGIEVAIGKDKMWLGSRTASDALALASKVDARCTAIEMNLQTHVHPTALGPSGPETPLIAAGSSTASTKIAAE